MLKNVKSSYIIKFIFTYLDEAQKLKLIKYTKSLQNSMKISIINYKLFNGKYLIYESNGIGKEYDGNSDDLIFEGEYLNGKRNGKGREYNSEGQLMFEGEYVNGKRNGKGKEYNSEGQLIFEGEYLNNKQWIGNIYDYSGKILYKLNNNNGKGKEYNSEGRLIFVGEYVNGQRNGKGKEYKTLPLYNIII